ncbi:MULTISPECIES: hypothetical protein [unclassified Rhizobium]|uniref:hypothetical protein n=1 Tax=unclassified Rhizobium TaxID=2613769 RepID=UPI0038252586
MENQHLVTPICPNHCADRHRPADIQFSGRESAANSLNNARMNKKRQMRWSPIGAHRLLQVRAAVTDGRLKQAKLYLAA